MLRPFLRAGVFSAHDPNAIPIITDFTGAPQFSGTGTLSVTAHASQNGNNFTSHPQFSGTGTLSVTAVKGGGGGGTGTTVPYTANQLIETIGVDTHWRYGDYSANQSMLVAALQDIGFRHYRDGMQNSTSPVSAYRILANAGITATMCIARPYGDGSIPKTASAGIALAKSTYAGCIQYVEGPNEPDIEAGTGWVSIVKPFMASLYPAVRSDSFFAQMPVKGSPFAKQSSFSAYGTDNNLDIVDLHTYSANHGAPEAGVIETWIKDSATSYIATKDRCISEWGYHTQGGSSTFAVDEQTYSDYLVRGILWNMKLGISQSSSYELWDQAGAVSPKEQSFGLLNSNGSYKKPAFTMKNFLGRLKDTGTGTAPSKYPVSWTTSGTDVEVMLIGRRDGSIDIAVWRKAATWDNSTQSRITVSPVNVNFTLTSSHSAVSYHLNTNTPTPTTLISSGTAFTVQADGAVQLVRVS